MSGCETCGYGATTTTEFSCGCDYTCFCTETTNPCTCGVGVSPEDDYSSDYTSCFDTVESSDFETYETGGCPTCGYPN